MPAFFFSMKNGSSSSEAGAISFPFGARPGDADIFTNASSRVSFLVALLILSLTRLGLDRINRGDIPARA